MFLINTFDSARNMGLIGFVVKKWFSVFKNKRTEIWTKLVIGLVFSVFSFLRTLTQNAYGFLEQHFGVFGIITFENMEHDSAH